MLELVALQVSDRIHALTSDTVGGCQKAGFFVVADSGAVEACAAGEFSDFHFFICAFVKKRLT